MSEVIELDGVFAGQYINTVCEKAAALASETNKTVHFTFNDTEVNAVPGESPETLVARWTADYEAAAKAYREHPDRIKEQIEREAKDKAEREVVMVDNSATEAQMRESDVPWPKTEKQLNQYIESLVKRNHDYGTCVYAMSMAAVAAFHYVAGIIGSSGFQASMADLDILRRTRHLKGPFMIINGEDALYPQYDLRGKLDEALEEWKPWLKEESEKKLAEGGRVHPDVEAHWKALAEQETAVQE